MRICYQLINKYILTNVIVSNIRYYEILFSLKCFINHVSLKYSIVFESSFINLPPTFNNQMTDDTTYHIHIHIHIHIIFRFHINVALNMPNNKLYWE